MNGDERTTHFGHFSAVPSSSPELWNTSAPWFQFRAPDGVEMNSAIEPISPQNTCWAVDSSPFDGLTSGMDNGLHSSMLSLPIQPPATNEPHNISKESSNHAPGSRYKSMSTSSPDTGHDLVRVDDAFVDITWDNILSDTSFDHESISSSVLRAWTPTSVSIY